MNNLNLRKNYQGYWSIVPKIAVKDSYSLSLVYTPGVGRVSMEIAENIEKSFELTNRANSVAVIGVSGRQFQKENMASFSEIPSIVIKAALYNKFSGIDAYPLLLESSEISEIAEIIINLAPTFAGFVLTGLSSNYSAQIKELLKNEKFNLPVVDDLEDDKKTAMLLRSLIGEQTIENFELHAERAKGVIKIENNFNNENISDETNRIAEEISKNSDAAYQLTPKGNLVAVISDGSAVLGLGNIGAEAALPVMEGKSVLFKTLGDVDAMPICLKTQNTEELIKIISKLSPILGGINLEDISAPRCFEIEKALIEKLNIPVFHDDQHGTAVVVLAGFINSLKLVGKKAEEIKVVVNGAGAGATAVAKLLLNYGVINLILCDRTGAIYNGRTEGMNFFKQEMAEITNPHKEKGLFKDVIKNADFFIGLSSGNIVNQEMIKSMAKKAVVFALANPIPEIMPEEALKAGAFIVATGRSDYKNQVNNSLAFPGIFRGVLDIRAEKITDEMKISAAHAIANLIQEHELNPEYIIPHALDLKVPPAVAKAVAETAIKANIAGIKINN